MAGGLCATLSSAFTLVGHIGVLRLVQKYPNKSERLTYWEPRWDTLRFALILTSTATQLGALTFFLAGFEPLAKPLSFHTGILLLGLLLLFALVFNILPKALSQHYADRLVADFLPFVGLLSRCVYPLAWPMAKLAELIHSVSSKGSDEEDHPSSEDEIRSLVTHAPVNELQDEEREIIQSVFEFGDTLTREIMTPRVDIEGLEDTETIASCSSKIKSSTHSRFPVFHETVDDIRGLVHVKDLLRLLREGQEQQPVHQAMMKALFVPETMPINDLLGLLRSQQAQLAIVVDEYGGTAGLVTMEDIIEELVGEIRDEYDAAHPTMQHLSDGSTIVDARIPVDEANELLHTSIPEQDDYESVGGFVYHKLGRIPRVGEVIDEDGFQITIQSGNLRKLHRLRILKKEPSPQE